MSIHYFYIALSCLPNPSADLWVFGSVPGAEDQGKQVSIQYSIGNIQGMYVSLEKLPH